jgi:periplasmic copper chaperone A
VLSRVRLAALLGSATLLFASTAFAHVGVSGPVYAKQSQVLTFSVGHGCEGADTYKVDVSIPKEVTALRVMPSVFGGYEVRTDDAGIITGVVWTKAANVRAKDDSYYQMGIRITVPDAPFNRLYFPAKQTCRKADGTESVVDWKATLEEVAAAKEGEEPEPAPTLVILPPRFNGWNKFTVKDKVADLSIFDDAQIVWAGDAAYSKNPATAELIKNEDGVQVLTEIKAGAEIWVKY